MDDTTQQLNKELPKKRRPKRDTFLLKLLPFGITAIVLFCLTAIGFGVYHNTWYSNVSRSLADTIHLPIAIAGSHVVTYTDFRRASTEYSNYQNTNIGLDSIIKPDTPIDLVIFTKIINDEFLEEAYKTYGVTVTQSDLDQEFESIFGVSPDSKYAAALVEQTLGSTPETLMSGILKEYVYKQKLTVKLYTDTNLIAQQRNLIEDVRNKITATPGLFDTYVDGSASTADVFYRYAGLVSPSELFGATGELKTLEQNELSSVIENSNRFSIYRVIQKITDSTGAVKYLEIQEIYSPKIGANELLSNKLASSRVLVLSPIYSWDRSCQSVIKSGYSCTGPIFNEEDFPLLLSHSSSD